MRVNELQKQLKLNNESLLKDVKDLKSMSSNPVSIFSVMNKCIEKADSDGDGTISEEELSIFMGNGSSNIMKELQTVIDEKNIDIDKSLLKQIVGLIQNLLGKTDEVSEDTSKLQGMTQEAFINNANNALEDENASDFWKAIGADDAENIFTSIDTDGDGVLSEEELKDIVSLDGDDKNISLTDLASYIGSLPEDEEAPVEEIPVQETPAVEPSNPGSVGGSNFSPSSGGSSPFNNISQLGNRDSNKARTSGDIDKEIQEQETKKTEVKQEADTKIKEQEGLIETAVNKSDLSEEFKEEYAQKDKEYSDAISGKEKDIEEQKGIQQDATAEIEACTSAIGQIDSQIGSLKSAINGLDPEKDSTKISEYNSKIQNLEAEKAKLEARKSAAETKKQDAETAIEDLEKEKADLIDKKDHILDELSEKYTDEVDKAKAVQEQIKEYQENIKQIQSDLDKSISEIDGKIQDLKTEKAKLVQQEQTDKILEANKVKADTSKFNASINDLTNMTAEERAEYWRSLGYDPEMGEKLAEMTIAETRQVEGDHQCLRAVRLAFEKYYGEKVLDPAITQSRAGNCLGIMQNREDYREITGLTPAQAAQYLPAGTVVVWEGTNNSNDDVVRRCGHICVLDGNGNEAAGNRYASMYKSVGINKPHYFIPVS